MKPASVSKGRRRCILPGDLTIQVQRGLEKLYALREFRFAHWQQEGGSVFGSGLGIACR